MWIAVRDLAFGPHDYPEPPIPDLGAGPRKRLVPEIGEPYEAMIRFMMSLLMIEYGAASTFEFNQRLLRDKELFPDRRPQAEEAACIVDRICQDEVIHVSSLRTFLGELRSVTMKTVSGGTIPGSTLIDRLWAAQVYMTFDQPGERRQQQEDTLRTQIREHPAGSRIEREFDALAG
jgi:hypothetical protein